MKTKTIATPAGILFVMIIFALSGAKSDAATYTWTGANGGSWGVNTNWGTAISGGTWPGLGDTAVIATNGVDSLNVYYDAPALGATGTLGTLNLVQPTTGTNQLSLLRKLVVSNADGITIGGMAGGASMLYLDVSDTGTGGNSITLSASSVTVNSGGILGLSSSGTGNQYSSTVASAVTINGGALLQYNSIYSSASAQTTISGNLSMISGTMIVGALNSGGSNYTDTRLSITGSCNISGGVVSSTAGCININGSGSNTIAGLLASTSYINWITISGNSSQDQWFSSNSTVENSYISKLTVRRTGTVGIGATSGTLCFQSFTYGVGSNGGALVVKLTSDATIKGGTPISVQFGPSGSGNTIYCAFDLNGYNLFTNSNLSLTGSSSAYATIWSIRNSAANTGALSASYFNFTGAAQVNVGDSSTGVVVLTATATGNNNLGTAGTIAANSVFSYIGSGTSSLVSGRAIGSLNIGNGTSASELVLNTTYETLQGNLTVNKNAVLSLLDKTVTETGGATGIGGLNGAGSIYNNGGSALAWGTANLVLNTAKGNGSFSGTIGDHSWGYGVVAVTLTGGTGTQTFTGTNTYSGNTTISAGNTLALGDGTHDGVISSSSSINNNGTLKYCTLGTQTYAGTISGSGTVTMMGTGTQTLSGNNIYTGATVVASGELDINGSLADASTVSVQTGATLGGSGTANGSVNVQSGHANGSGLKLGATTFDGNSTVSGATTVASATVNSGTTTASGVITSNGNLSIIAGATLKNTGTFSAKIVNVANTATLTNNGTLSGTVNVSGVLNGTGTVNGALTIKTNGELAPGNSPGLTTVAGNLTVETGAKISMQIEGITTAGGDYDKIVVKGASSLVALSAGSILNLTISDGVFTSGSLILIENQSDNAIVGTFSSVVIGGSTYDVGTTNRFTYGGKEYELLYNVNADGGAKANDFELAVVPEPGTWAMLLGGLGMLFAAQRCRRILV